MGCALRVRLFSLFRPLIQRGSPLAPSRLAPSRPAAISI